MLHKLFIQNYAIIDELVVKFHPRFNIITGETGAGKSILAGALGVVLGERADSNVLRDTSKKCIVEASFHSKVSKEIKEFFLQEDLETDDSIMIRREIAASGKSRSFINDTPVNLTQLKALAGMLVDLHQQFDTLELGDNDFQRAVVDALAGHGDILLQYQNGYRQYTGEQKRLQELKIHQANASKELDYYKYLFTELEETGLAENELEDLDQELHVLSNAENIKSKLSAAYFGLTDGEIPLVQQLKIIAQQLQSLKAVHSGVLGVTDRLVSAQIELSDIADELEALNDNVNLDPERLNIVNERLAAGDKLLKKHQVTTTAALLAIQQSLALKLEQVLNIDDTVVEKEKLVDLLQKEALLKAALISDNRKKIIPDLEQRIAALLKQVGMPNALLKVRITTAGLQLHGSDEIEFLFDANKSGKFEPLRKVASGGELSRLMLSIKSIVARSMQLPTLIFDEIDTGISGEAARQVGAIMKDLAQHHQVISITHQPQIAARADAHFYVYKKEKQGIIQTGIRQLADDERVDAIANMMAGDNPSVTVLQNAKEMLLQ
ncbi:MAG: DNA repair protein RecN [Chitinophagaceae bacterium]